MNKLLATTTFLALAGTATADGAIIDQVFDFTNGLASERNTQVNLATTADDFVISDKNTITDIWATFVVDGTPLADYEYEIYTNADGVPGDLIAAGNGGAGTDTGDTLFDLTVLDIHFQNISIILDPGVYWLAVRGVGRNMGERAFWDTANFGNPNGSDAMFKSVPFGYPDWTPWEQLLGSPTDVAFTIHAVPTPAPLALLAVAALAARRRRRV